VNIAIDKDLFFIDRVRNGDFQKATQVLLSKSKQCN